MTEIRTETRSVTVEGTEDHPPYWIVLLADSSVLAIPRLFDAPPAGTQLTVTTAPYKLDPATDPHQDIRHRTIRVQWGDVVIHCAEFDELLAERDRLREMVLAMREQAQQVHPAIPLGALGERLRDALDALFGPRGNAGVHRSQATGPFQNGVPPWARPPGQGGER